MQGKQDMTLDSLQDPGSAPRTTAAGLETWLSGRYAEPARATASAGAPHAQAAATQASAEAAGVAEAIGPVNLAEAIALGRVTNARKLTGPDGAELIIDPDNHAYHFESTALKPLTAILQQPADRWVPVYSEALKAARAAHAAQPLERLRWYAGLIATPGILGRELSRNEHYKLTGWPETEREFPRHFRIAKELSKDPATADEIATAAGMPYEDVVDYMNASHAAGRLTAASAPHAAAERDHTIPRKGRLMARLNKPLFAR
ncbi:MAG: hypothetical protein EPN38_03765 [Rhodanobacteraceae bacterium]|nr:MAG: hypothetical protein EPN38_03765 [Rhodanobacteraceae bacterium]